MATNPLERAFSLVRTLVSGYAAAPEDVVTRTAHRLVESTDLHDGWAKRVIELADGRTVGEIATTIYGDELRCGAWIADIGLWRHLYYRSVIAAVEEMAERGHIALSEAGRD